MRAYKLLIADDDRCLTQMLSLTLEESGFEVHQAINCQEAIELLNREKFDGLLLDYQLPDGNGIELFRVARQICEQIPVMMLSGFSEVERIAKSHGIEHILLKPVSFEVLRSKLEGMLN